MSMQKIDELTTCVIVTVTASPALEAPHGDQVSVNSHSMRKSLFFKTSDSPTPLSEKDQAC